MGREWDDIGMLDRTYGCHSMRTGDTKPRGASTLYYMRTFDRPALVSSIDQDAIPILTRIETQWNDMACGYRERATDHMCDGCANQAR